MAIDKIVIQYEAQVAEFKRELDGIKAQLKSVETTAASGAKKTEKSLNDVGKGANDLKETIKGLGQQIAAAFAAREIIRFTKQTIDAASDLNETLSKSQQIFGDASKAVEEFASNSAKQFGMSKQTAIDAAASFGVFGKSAGLTGKDLSTFSTDLVALSADLASFGNTTPEEAALALGAALRGEAEPIRRFGVLLDDATLRQEALSMGIIKTTKEALTPQEKVLAANAVIFRQTADAQGDFARTSEGVANQQRILEANFKNLQTEVGARLLPTFNNLLKNLNELLKGLDADDVLTFAKAAAATALAFGGWKLGPVISMLPQLAKGIMTVNGGMLALNKTLKTNLFTAAFAFALPYIIDFIDGVDEAEQKVDELAARQEELKAVTEQLVAAEAEQLGVANNYFSALSKTNPKSKERKELIDEINKRYGTTLKNLSDEVKFQNQLKEAQDKVIEGIKAKIALQIQEEKYTTLLKQRAQFAGKAMQEEAKLNELEKKFVEERGMTIDQYNKSLVDQRINEMALSQVEQEKAERTRKLIQEGDQLLNQINQQAKAYNIAQNEVVQIDNEIENLDADTKNLVNSLGSLTGATNETGGSTEKAKTKIEQITAEIAKLNEDAENLAAKGDYIGAEKAATAAGVLQGRLNALKTAVDEYRKAAEDAAKPIETISAKPVSVDTGIFKDLQIPDTMGIKVKLNLDKADADKAKEETLKKVGEIKSEMEQVFGVVNSVLGPAMNALNGYFDLQLNNLEKQKNQRLANEKLTAEERLRIEEEYEAKKNAIMAEQFEVSRANQIIQATMSAAQAALNAYASIAVIPAIGPGLAPAAAAVAAAFGALQIGIISAQPNPYKFFEGTDYLQLGGNPRGKDTIPVMAHEGEAIIPTKKNLQYPGLAKSWIDGNLDSYIHKKFISPALMEQQREMEADFADKIADSMALQMTGGFDDYRLFRAIKEQTAIQRVGFENLKQTRKKLRGA